MITIHKNLDGQLVLDQDTKFAGHLNGDLVVPSPHKLELTGLVTGDVVVRKGGQAIVRGTVDGTVFNYGGSVDIFGRVGSVAGTAPSNVVPGAKVDR